MVTKENVIESMTNFINEEVKKELQKVVNAINYGSLSEVQKDEFVSNLSEADVCSIWNLISEKHNELFKQKIDEYIGDNTDFIKREDIDVSVVDECGLSEDVAENYYDNLSNWELKDKICDLINNL